MDMMHEQNVALQGADESTAPKRLPFSKVGGLGGWVR